MARPTKSDVGLPATLSFRVVQTCKNDFIRQSKESGLTQSEFLRELLQNRKATIVARPKKSQDKKRLLFLFNKTSNNINQLAYRVNADHLEGRNTDSTYQNIANELEAIRGLLLEGIKNVD